MTAPRRRLRRFSSATPQNTVINRGEVPVVVRGDDGARAGVRRLVLLLILGIGFWIVARGLGAIHRADPAGSSASLSEPTPAPDESTLEEVTPGLFRVSSVVVTSTTRGDQTTWRVGGRLTNQTRQERAVPSVRVRLTREADGRLVADVAATLPEASIPPFKDLPFGASFRTPAGEGRLRADILLLKGDGPEVEDKR